MTALFYVIVSGAHSNAAFFFLWHFHLVHYLG